ncbi:hypothetical protein [Mycolicibacter kumamotonensis]|uniref:dioxygenase family protein n=1 Tax=Mycolicibacter kumamotonensis TaxID=354243 RepID=UPI0008065C13|nr:hypothetical protein [Mycolicibacter kumamotonensis]
MPTAAPVIKWRPEDPDAAFVPDASKISPRLIEIKDALVHAVSGVFRDKGITHAEYERFRQVLVELQQMGVVHGFVDIWLDKMTDASADDEWPGTTSNPEGPLYVPGAPVLEPVGPGASYVLPQRENEPGTPLIISGQVRWLDGTPLGRAEIDVWQCCADTGIYSNFGLDDQPDWNLRGKFRCDADGRYVLRTVKPVPYMTPGIPQPILDIWDALGKAHFRPAHVHMKVRHDDLPDGMFMTQMYFTGDPYLGDNDPGENSQRSLEVSPTPHSDPEELKAQGLEGYSSYLMIEFDIVAATTISDSGTSRADGLVH